MPLPSISSRGSNTPTSFTAPAHVGRFQRFCLSSSRWATGAVKVRESLSSSFNKLPALVTNTARGFLAATVISPLKQPFVCLKIEAQRARKSNRLPVYSMNPRIWFRGFWGYTGGFAPFIATQFAATGFYKQYLPSLPAGMLGGATSAVVFTPITLLLNLQQKMGENYVHTIRHIHNSYGASGFFRGLVPISFRCGIYVTGYNTVTPFLKKKIVEQNVSPTLAQVLAGILGGATAAIASHGYDTRGTQMQCDFTMKSLAWYKTPFAAGAMSGVHFRIVMLSLAAIFFPLFQKK